MLKFISKLFGGSKSEKDVQKIMPVVQESLACYAKLQELSHDELRGKTLEFRERIRTHLSAIDNIIQEQKNAAEELPVEDIHGRDEIYRNIDKLRKDRDKKIEEVLFSLKRRFIVPRYQRPYAWNLEQITEFWSDLITNNEPYFLGSFVFLNLVRIFVVLISDYL